ncbi:MAG: hypothetical protein AMJ59_18675 [Gammaproteobacteria bacterium SG8_31]|jgi:hypothetical protein|nr:MAG: hypothetical protein AMJ59_18675 [Gammaproteobacteria bacterium SG8_31]
MTFRVLTKPVAILTVALLAGGCVVSETRPVEYTPAVSAQTEIAREKRLSVAVVEFDPGLPEAEETAEEKLGVPPEVRKAESRFIAFHLKETLEQTGQWGPVRVLPAERLGAELTVTGEILHSDGEELEVELRVRDATGQEWLHNKYKARADSGTYSDGEVMGRDPFQNLYNQVANDLLAARSRIDEGQLRQVREVAGLRFAQDLAPAVFEGYLEQGRNGDFRVVRLPAEGDPMMVRMEAVRNRDLLFVDTLNEYYASFYREMEAPYDSWRKYSYDEALALRELKAAARWRKLIGAAAVVGSVMMESDSRTADVAGDVMLIGGIELFRQGIQVGKEAKMQAEVLAELGTSFGQEIQPAVVEVAGETRRLEGSAATQYAEWRKLLREIYETETGLPAAPVGSDVIELADHESHPAE